MKITLNYDTCIASGNCGYLAPQVFQNREEDGGFVSLALPHPPASEEPAVRRAERLCPSGTIFVTEEAEEKQFVRGNRAVANSHFDENGSSGIPVALHAKKDLLFATAPLKLVPFAFNPHRL